MRMHLFALTVVATLLTFLGPVAAAETASTTTEAALSVAVDKTAVPIDGTVTLTVTAADAVDVYGSLVHVYYDPTALQLLSATAGTLVPGGLAAQDIYTFVMGSEIGSLRRASVVAVRVGNQTGATGSGPIGTLTFKALKNSITTFALGSSVQVELVDSSVQPVPATGTGSVSVVLGNQVALSVTPDPSAVLAGGVHYTTASALTFTGTVETGASLTYTIGSGTPTAITVGDTGAFQVVLPLADGPNAISFLATKSDGTTNPNEIKFSVTRDNAPPSIFGAEATVARLNNPYTPLGTEVAARGGETVTIRFTVNEGLASGSPTVEAAASFGGTLQPVLASVNQSTYTFTLAIPAGQDGSVAVTLKALDYAGNAGSVTLPSFTVDSTTPTITLTQPPTSPTSATSTLFAFTVTDASLALVTVNGTTVTPTDTVYTFSGALAEGSNSFVIRALDKAGLEQSLTVPVLQDKTGPVVATTQVSPATITGSAQPLFTIPVSDSLTEVVTGSLTVSAPVGSVSVPLTFAPATGSGGKAGTFSGRPAADLLPSGQKEALGVPALFRVEDAAGNVTEYSWTFDINTNVPVPQATADPAANPAGWHNTRPTVTLAPAPGSPAGHIYYVLVPFVNGEPGAAPTDKALFATYTGSFQVNEGKADLYAFGVADQTGLSSEIMKLATYMVDLTPPTAPSQVGYQFNGAKAPYLKAGDSIDFAFTAEAGLAATYRVVGEQVTGTGTALGLLTTGSLTGSGTQYTATYTVPADAGLWRSLQFRLLLTDAAGLTASATFDLTGLVIDTAAPVIGQVKHDAKRPLRADEALRVEVQAEPNLAETTRVQLWNLDQAMARVGDPQELAVTEVSAGIYRVAYTVLAGENRALEVAAVQTDLAGNRTEAATGTPVILDTTAPGVGAVTVATTARVDSAGTQYYAAGDVITVQIATEKGLLEHPSDLDAIRLAIPGLGELTGLTWVDQSSTDSTTSLYQAAYTVTAGQNSTRTLDNPAGKHPITIAVVDAAGNQTLTGTATLVLVDTTNPLIHGAATSPTAVLKAGAALHIAAAAEPGLKSVAYSFELAGGLTRTGTMTPDPTAPGFYRHTYSVAQGENTPSGGAPVTLTFEDWAGNRSSLTIAPIYFDTVTPVLDNLTATPASGTLKAGDSLTLSFTGESGLLVGAHISGLRYGLNLTESPGTGSSTYSVTVPILAGMNVATPAVTLFARDAAWNVATSGFTLPITVDTIPPKGAAKLDALPTGRNGWYVVTPTLTIAVESGAAVALTDSGTLVSLGAPSSASGVDTYTYQVPDGERTFALTIRDAAGNSTAIPLPSIKVDTVKPGPMTIDPIQSPTRAAAVTVTGTLSAPEPDVTAVRLFVNDIPRGIHPVTNGSFAISGVRLEEHLGQTAVGRNEIKVQTIDTAGNLGAISNVVTVTRDSTPPSFAVGVDGQTLTVTSSETLSTGLTVTGTIDGAALTFSAPTVNGNVYQYTITEDIATGTLKIGVAGRDQVGNRGFGSLVRTVVAVEQASEVSTDDGGLKLNFEAGDLTDSAIVIKTVEANSLVAEVPSGMQLLGSGYSVTAQLGTDKKADVIFTVQISGTVPPQIPILYVPGPQSVHPKSTVLGTTEVLSTDEATGVKTVRVTVTLPHFSTWAPGLDTTPPAFVGAVTVNGIDTTVNTNPLLNTATATVAGSVDGTAVKIDAIVAGTTEASSNLGAAGTTDKPFNLSVPLGVDGSKTVTLKVYDEYNNSATIDLTMTLDTTKPVLTTLQVNGANYTGEVFTSGLTASVAGSSEADATLTVMQGTTALVSGALGSFSTNVALTANQSVTLTVQATDRAGNQSDPSTLVITQDGTAPVISLSGMGTTGSTSTTIGYSVSEPVTSVTLSVDGGATLATTSSTQQSLSGIGLTVPASGTYTITVTAVDRAGNSAVQTGTVIVDPSVPVVTATVSPNPTNGTANLTITATSGGQPAEGVIAVTVNSTALALTDTTITGGSRTITLSGLAEGDNTVAVTVTGVNGLSGSTTVTVTRDTAPPSLTGASISPLSTTSATTVQFTLTEDATVRIEYKASTASAWSTGYDSGATFRTAGTVSQSISLPSAGTYSFRVALTDRAGNAATVSLSDTVSRTDPVVQQPPSGGSGGGGTIQAPVISLTPVEPLTREATVTLSGTVSSATSVTITRSGETVATVAVNNGSFEYVLNLAEGENALTFSSQNSAGTGTANLTIVRDSKAPTLSIDPVKPTTLALTILRIQTEKDARIFINGEQVAAAGSTGLATPSVDLAVGTNRFEVVAVDAAGNRSDTVVVTVERTVVEAPAEEPAEPAVTISLGQLPAVTEQARVTVTGTATAGAKVTITAGGRVVAEPALDGQGRFTASVPLSLGVNLITATAKLEGARASASADLFRLALQVKLSDISDHWAKAGIQRLAEAGVISGYEDGSFRPEGLVTRAEFAKMIVTALNLEIDENAELTFADTDQIPAWARPYIAAAVKAGLITGFEDKTFRAGEQITRLQIAVIVSRGLKAKGVEAEGEPRQFNDAAEIPAWASAAIETATRAGLIGGFEDGTFRPNEKATRAQAAIMTLRLMDK